MYEGYKSVGVVVFSSSRWAREVARRDDTGRMQKWYEEGKKRFGESQGSRERTRGKKRERERRRTSGPKRGPRRATQHNKSRGWWRTAGQMHFTTRSAATMEPTSWYHPVTPVDSTLRGLTPDYVQLDARRAPSAPSELISVISRSCNLSRLLHGQLIIIAIPISGAIR